MDTSLPHPAPRALTTNVTGPARLRLVSTGDGWSLVAEDGYCIYSALGTSGRRRCLEAARAFGALALTR